MKKRITAAALALLLFTLLSMIGAYNLHCLLARQTELCSLSPAAMLAAFSIPKVRLFFFLLLASSALAVGYMVFSSSYLKYKSDMQHITPDICTPCAEGQGQYGTAQWLPATRLPNVFSVACINENDPLIACLLQEGARERDEIDYG